MTLRHSPEQRVMLSFNRVTKEDDEFTKQAATALIEYVNSAEPTNYQRTVYYLDFDLQIDISVQNGEVSVAHCQISEEKSSELFEKFYK